LGGNRTIFESRIIMDYLEHAYPKDGIKLYSECPEERAA